MAAHTQTYSAGLDRLIVARKHESFIDRLIPRRCMVVSTGLILIGLSIPFLMAFQLIPSTFMLNLAGFIIALIGSALALFLYGEI